MYPVVLAPEKDTQNPHLHLCFVGSEIENRAVFGDMPQPIHDMRHKSALKWHIPQTGQRIFYATHATRRAVQRIVNRLAKIAVGLEQVVKDNLDIRVTGRAAENLKPGGHVSWPRSYPRSGCARLQLR